MVEGGIFRKVYFFLYGGCYLEMCVRDILILIICFFSWKILEFYSKV